MRENRTCGSEGGETGTTGLPYPYRAAAPIGANRNSDAARHTQDQIEHETITMSTSDL